MFHPVRITTLLRLAEIAFAGGTAAMIQQSSAQLKGLEKTCEFEVGVGAVPQDTTLSYPAVVLTC